MKSMYRFMRNGRSAASLMQQRGRQGLRWSCLRMYSVQAQATKPCLVLSNDDGVESPALLSLAAKLRQETGHRVLVVAPSGNKSAASMGLTLRHDMELRVRPDLGPDTFALTGTPTDCMMVALDATKGLMRALDLHPVMALSGPNYGPNMGTDVLLSGTVGAARTAGLYGVPALASSSTSLDKASKLDNAVDATLALANLALETLGGQPARNWPRNHIVVGSGGRRHVNSACDYEALPHSWVMDMEQVLVDAFRDGDVFLNLNVPAEWRRGRNAVQTTGLGLMFYRDSYVVSVPGQAPCHAEGEPALVGAAAAVAPGAPVAAAAVNGNGNGNGNGIGSGRGGSYGNGVVRHTMNGNGSGYVGHHCNGHGHGATHGSSGSLPTSPSTSAVVKSIAEALAAGLPVVYNNAYDTRRTVSVDRSDVMALMTGDISISTLQTWPEGHTLCLSDRVMSRALLSGHDGMPAWLKSLTASKSS